ncbi:MAG: metalloregulator ArsR/SmtB family transcription factor [Steroidobacteraceae bacterium]
MGEYRNAAMDKLLGAVADSTRRAILARLAAGDARVTEVAADFPISLNSVSKHVRMLERAGLVRRTVRGRDHVLSLDAAPLAEAAAWIAHYQRFWEDRLEALDQFVKEKRKQTRKRKRK